MISVPGLTSVEEGGTLELICTATGSPPPTIQVMAQSNDKACKRVPGAESADSAAKSADLAISNFKLLTQQLKVLTQQYLHS